MRNTFASSGSCIAPPKVIRGQVEGITFTSPEFTGIMDSQKFWDDLAAYAKRSNAFIILVKEES